jgi:hypothetical protein
MAGRLDLDLYNVLLGFGWVRERVELVRAIADPGFLLRARRALLPIPGLDRPTPPPDQVLPPLRRRQLGDTLTVIDAADHRLLRGPSFYDLFIDRSRWPELIREGYTARARRSTRSGRGGRCGRRAFAARRLRYVVVAAGLPGDSPPRQPRPNTVFTGRALGSAMVSGRERKLPADRAWRRQCDRAREHACRVRRRA